MSSKSPRNRTTMAMAFALAAGIAVASHAPATAATCGNTGAGFDRWLAGFKRQAVAAGIPRRVVESALGNVRYSSYVIKLDRNQRSFKLSFDRFWRLRVNNAMIRKGRRLLRQHAGLFRRIERRFGVPGPIIVAIWGLETNFGRNTGKMPVFRSLATLAYDCRRADFFRNELMSALKIVARGDMRPSQMKGAWAGEIGQTQFLASKYLQYAVDFDGDGRRDLIRSTPDALASTANFLRAHGWRPGGDWHPGTHNYEVIKQWNRATVYQKTIARLADLIAGKR